MNVQIPLSFPISESYRADDYMPTDCNQEALRWINLFPNWSYPALIIYGERGCGKTHLLSLWQDMAGDKHRAIDDAERFFGSSDSEEELFHQFNIAKEKGSFLLLALSKNMAQQELVLPDLSSRLKAAPQIEIHSPDDVALQNVLVKMFNDRQLKVEPGVISYILPRIERSFNAARNLVQQIDENSLAEKRSVTVPLVRSIIAEPELFL